MTAGEKASIYDTLEWLNDIGSLEAEPEEGPGGDTLPVAETKSGPQWRRDVGMLQPEEHAGPEEEAESPNPKLSPSRRPSPDRASPSRISSRVGRVPSRVAGRAAARLTAGRSGGLPARGYVRASGSGAEPPDNAESDPADSQPWLDEASGPAWLRRVIEEEDDSEG